MERKPIHDIVKDIRWQKVRESLLGQWKTRPEWCCQQLRKYIGKLTGATNDELRILMNYCTGSVFRTGTIKHPCVTKLRKELSIEMNERKNQARWY
jgi:hypothetical protein